MIATINTSDSAINWTARDKERVVQNIKNLLSTRRYEIAYDRTLGIDPSIIDKPITQAQPLYVAEIYRIITDYEPRARIRSVTVTADAEGNMQVEVVIEL